MKKLYLALVAAVLCCSSALADGVNVLFYRSYNTDWTTAYSWTYGGDISSDQWIQAKYLGKETQPFFVLASTTKFGNSIFTQSGSWNGSQTSTLTLTSLNEGALAYGYSSSTTSSRSGKVYSTSAAELYGQWDGSSWSGIALTQKSGVVYKTATKTMPSSGSVEYGFRLTESGSQVLWTQPKANLSATSLATTLTGGSTNPKITLEEGTEYHLEVDFSTLALTLVIDKVATKTAPDNVYFYGTMYGSDWGSSNTLDAKQMTKDGNKFTLSDVTINAASSQKVGYFFMATNNVTAWSGFGTTYYNNSGTDQITVGSAAAVTADTAGSKHTEWQVDPGTYDVTYDWENATVTLTKKAPAELYLIGDFEGNSWISGGGIKMTKNGNVYTATTPALVANSSDSSTGHFQMITTVPSSWDNVSKATRYTAASQNQAVVAGTNYTVLNNASNSYDWTGQIGYVYTVTFDYSSMTLTVTATAPETNIYLYGNLYGGSSWTSNSNELEGKKLNKSEDNDGIYTLEDVTFYNCGNGSAYFFLANANVTTWDGAKASNVTCYYTGSSNHVEAVVDKATNVVAGSGSYTQFYVTAGTYDLTFDLNNLTVTLSTPVDESEEDAAKDLTYVTDFTVTNKPAADEQLTEFGVGSLSITNKKVLTVTLQGDTKNDADAKIGWIKYEDLSNYTSKEWYLSDNTEADYEAYLSANNLKAGYTNWAGQFITGNRTWALDSSDNATTHDCRNFSQAYYRVYVYKTTEHKAKKSGVSTKTVPAKSVSTRVALSIDMPENTTGVDEITIDSDNQSVNDADAPVEYYNLQGIRISNPSNGIYIRRQGNSVSKEYVR